MCSGGIIYKKSNHMKKNLLLLTATGIALITVYTSVTQCSRSQGSPSQISTKLKDDEPKSDDKNATRT
jgi:hypothetical protein